MDRADQAEASASSRGAPSANGGRDDGRDGGQDSAQNGSQRGPEGASADESGSGARIEPGVEGPAGAAGTVTVVDARGHRCPMPLLMAKRGLNGVAPGERIRVLSTDAGSLKDFETFARQSGHRLLSVDTEGDEYHLLLERAPVSS